MNHLHIFIIRPLLDQINNSEEEMQPLPAKARSTSRGKLGWLIKLYLQSPEFQALKPATKRQRVSMLEGLAEDKGTADLEDIGKAAIQASVNARRDKPFVDGRRDQHRHRAAAQVCARRRTARAPGLTTAHGLAWDKNHLGWWFGKRCRAIGLDRSAHGLRKAAARRYAERAAASVPN